MDLQSVSSVAETVPQISVPKVDTLRKIRVLYAAGQVRAEWWMKLFPGYHPVRVMVDTGITTDLDTAVSLGWGFSYLLVVGLLAVWVHYRGTRTT